MIVSSALALIVAGCAADDAPESGSESSTGDDTLSSADSMSSAASGSAGTTSAAADETSTGSVDVGSSSEASTDPDTAGTFGTDVCGDGSRDPGEECDDGNVLNGDACSATCALAFEILWTATVNGDTDGITEARGVVVDENDMIYVAGRRTTATGAEAWIGQYASDGTPGWTLATSGPDDLGAEASAIARTPGGDLGMVGQTQTATLDQAMLVASIDPSVPSFVWTHSEIGGVGLGVGSDPDGNLVVTGGGDEGRVWVGELDATGALSWGQSAPVVGADFDIGLGLAVDADGSAAVLAMTSSGESALLAFADDGTPMGEVDTALGVWVGTAIARGDADDTLVAGAGPAGLAVWTLDTSFDVVAESTWGASMVSAAQAIGVADSRIHIAGAAGGNAWVGGFDENGDPLWSDQYENPNARGAETWNGLAIDSAGDVIVVGRQPVAEQQTEMVIRKYRVF